MSEKNWGVLVNKNRGEKGLEPHDLRSKEERLVALREALKALEEALVQAGGHGTRDDAERKQQLLDRIADLERE